MTYFIIQAGTWVVTNYQNKVIEKSKLENVLERLNTYCEEQVEQAKVTTAELEAIEIALEEQQTSTDESTNIVELEAKLESLALNFEVLVTDIDAKKTQQEALKAAIDDLNNEKTTLERSYRAIKIAIDNKIKEKPNLSDLN